MVGYFGKRACSLSLWAVDEQKSQESIFQKVECWSTWRKYICLLSTKSYVRRLINNSVFCLFSPFLSFIVMFLRKSNSTLHVLPLLTRSIFSPTFLRWVWFSTAGQWFQPSQAIRTWPGKLPPMPGWWWWREGTRLTSNWRGGTWWEGGSTPLSPGFWYSPCRSGWGTNGDVLVIVQGMEGRV